MTTHIQTLQSLLLTDMSIAKTELVDVDILNTLAKSDKISIDDHKKLSAIKKKISNGNELDVSYKLGKSMKTEDLYLGRLCAVRSIGLQTLPRAIRSALAKKNYWDVDVVACHPTLALQLCEKYNIVCDRQRSFLANRETQMTELAEHLQVDRDRVKARINALYFGYETACSGMPDSFTQLHKEILSSRSLIVNHPDWIEQVKFLKNKDNRIGCAFAYVLQTIERSVLLELDKSASRNKRSLDTYIHDGGLIRKVADEKLFPEALLRTFEKDIHTAIDFKVRLIVKPLETNLDISNLADGNYQLAKAEFEKTCFKINNPACYVRKYNDQLCFLDIAKLGHIYANKFVDDELFINKWRADPDNLTYERVEFLPAKQTPDDTYNLWRGFPTTAVEGDVSVIREVLRLICSSDVASMNYVEDWLAHMFQKPYEKPRVCICTQSDEEGTGKDTFWNFIGSMVGMDMFFNTGRPEDCVFGRFNGSLKEVLLLKFEEADFETNKKNENALKTLITCENVSYESKNENAVTLNSFVRLVMTTNNVVPFVMSDTSRRFMMLKASAEKRGNREFWTHVHKVLSTQEAKSSYFDYLMKRDISTFNPNNYPITAYAQEVMTASRPSSAAFFQRIVESAMATSETPEPIEWNARELLNQMNDRSRFTMTDQKFGREMSKYTRGLARVKGRTCNLYVCNVLEMRKFLESKHWWVDL